MEEDDTIIDASDKFMWNAVTFSFIQENVVKGITYLDLSTNHVSFESAIFLAKFISEKDSTLRGLCLVSTHLTTRAAKVIFEAVGSSKLIEFFADNNILVQESCETLGEALKMGPPLEILSLCGCNISSEGGIAIASSLPHLKHLEHLRLESNNLFDFGAQEIAKTMQDSTYTHLSLADNEIWMDGTKSLLTEIGRTQRIVSLDISYNIVDLDLLSRVLTEVPMLEELCISGCKVKEDSIANFLGRLPQSHLKILIADGFDFNILPVSWPKIQDKTFSQQVYFEMLMRAIIESETLSDIRVGFIELDSVMKINTLLQDANIEREIHFSIHDFGRTGNCWVCHYPDFSIESPCDTLKWQSEVLNDEGPRQIGNIYNVSLFNGEKLKNIDVSNCSLTDRTCIDMLQSLNDVELNYFDLGTNKFGDPIVDHLIDMLKRCYVRDLRLEKTLLTDDGLAKLMKFLAKDISRCPRELSFTVISEDKDQLSKHQTFIELANVLSKTDCIESLCLDGVITAPDIQIIVEEMKGNPNVRELNFDTDLISEYSSPDPPIDENVTAAFSEMSKSLHAFVTEGDCALKDFKFPLYTEIFIYCDPQMMEQWHQIEAVIEENNKK